MPRNPKRTGHDGETLAARHLEAQGYLIIARNWRSPHTRHEIDISARDGDCIVFVEVKTAQRDSLGDPLEWITPRKRAAIVQAARAYVATAPETSGGFRFDAVAIGPRSANGEMPINHIKSAFTADEAGS